MAKVKMAQVIRFVGNLAVLVSLCWLCSCAMLPGGDSKMNEVTMMGDWHGTQKSDDGKSAPLVAQVIALGDGKFKANLLSEFDKGLTPLAVLDGQLAGGVVRFEPNRVGDVQWEGSIASGKFSGSFIGAKNGSFKMKKVVRLSPSVGAMPPENAIVLFDGENFDKWGPGEPSGLVRIYSVIGKSKAAAAYIRSTLYSEKEQQGFLAIGSDDGVKAWLNGKLVHSNNVIRMWKPDEDKEWVTLKRGWNLLVLKVTTKGGPFGASVRFTDENGGMLYDVWEKDIYSAEGKQTRAYLDKNGSFVTVWEISGPYKEEGKDANSLFDIAFAPEKGEGKDAKWQQIDRTYFEKNRVRWLPVYDAMEVAGGTGSIVTWHRFGDFKLHLEFRTPFMPKARGQKRGNSGVYLQGRYEVQILDSYGLKGENNECGAIYEMSASSVNMCAPPLQWQSYDITFCAANFDEKGKKIRDARVTVIHNGVKVQDNVSISGSTAYPLDYNENEWGGILLQDHADSVQYRNIWAVELSEGMCNN